jgi:Alcohol dehydrogenase GroES-like domain
MTQTATTTATTIPDRMRASVLTGVKTLSIEQVPTPPMASDEVLIEVAAVGVCGSETHYYRHGRIGDFVVTGPLILGHELSVRIVAVAKMCRKLESASGWPSSRRRIAADAGNAAPAATTSVPTWSSTPLRRSTARSRSIA